MSDKTEAASEPDALTISEAANLLFVSRAHVLKLVERGVLTRVEVLGGESPVNKDDVERYKAARDDAAETYFATQREDLDPPGL
ncbi:excisionase family DNA-binding protein [Paraburkholderia nemoris]|jgi:excisionase family DNA binding protein|uniref:excisionase family DNA-binding protein n=1 Tax=Paraburkholderia nemoris TaxID=2793076 RepID=UPI0038B7BE96